MRLSSSPYVHFDLIYFEEVSFYLLNVELQRETERSSIQWFPTHMVTMARADPDQSQEPGTSYGSPMRLAGAQAIGSSPDAIANELSGSYISSKVLGLVQ